MHYCRNCENVISDEEDLFLRGRCISCAKPYIILIGVIIIVILVGIVNSLTYIFLFDVYLSKNEMLFAHFFI